MEQAIEHLVVCALVHLDLENAAINDTFEFALLIGVATGDAFIAVGYIEPTPAVTAHIFSGQVRHRRFLRQLLAIGVKAGERGVIVAIIVEYGQPHPLRRRAFLGFEGKGLAVLRHFQRSTHHF